MTEKRYHAGADGVVTEYDLLGTDSNTNEDVVLHRASGRISIGRYFSRSRLQALMGAKARVEETIKTFDEAKRKNEESLGVLRQAIKEELAR